MSAFVGKGAPIQTGVTTIRSRSSLTKVLCYRIENLKLGLQSSMVEQRKRLEALCSASSQAACYQLSLISASNVPKFTKLYCSLEFSFGDEPLHALSMNLYSTIPLTISSI